jgi:hypothetical protein
MPVWDKVLMSDGSVREMLIPPEMKQQFAAENVKRWAKE